MNRIQLEAVLKLVGVEINPQVFRQISRATAGLPTNLKKTEAATKGVAAGMENVKRKTDKVTSSLSRGEKAARLFLQRMAQFAILLPTFATINRAIQGSVKFLFEFDSALSDIVRIDISGLRDRMEEIGDAALKTARDFGVSATEVLNTTKIFKQAGFEIETSQKKAQAAILATQISTLNLTQATELFIAAEKQFGDAGADAAAVLDKVARVEDLAAVGAKDVAEAFVTGGNALAFFTKNLDDTIGLVTALREQTRKSGREVGTFFKTLATRISAAGDAQNAVKALGVEVVNLDGSLRSGLTIIQDLSAAFDGLTESQQATAAKSIAGVRQFEGLLATLKSVGRATELSAEANDAAGTSAAKRLITDEKLERQLGKLIAQGQSFAAALGDAGVTDTLRSALKIATELLKVFTLATDAAGDLGLSLTPLLALGGLALGKNIFGFGKGIAGGGKGGAAAGGGAAGGPAAGDPTFIGPLQKQANVLSGTFAKLSATTTATIAQTRALSTSFAVGSKAALNSISTRAKATQTLKNLAVAAGRAAVSLTKTAGRGLSQGFTPRGQRGVGAAAAQLAIATVGAALIGKAADSLSTKLEEGGNTSSAALAKIGGEGLQTAAQFAFLGPAVAGLVGLFTAAAKATEGLIEAINDEFAAREEIAELGDREQKIAGAATAFRLDTDVGDKLSGTLIDSLEKNIKSAKFGADFGKETAKVLKDVENALRGTAFEGAAAADVLFRDGQAISGLLEKEQDRLRTLAEENDAVDELNALLEDNKDGLVDQQGAWKNLFLVVGAGRDVVNELAAGLKNTIKSFQEFKQVESITQLAVAAQQLGAEFDLAKLGPDALSDSLVKLQQTTLLAESANEKRLDSIRRERNALVNTLLGGDEKLGQINVKGIGEIERLFDEAISTQSIESIDKLRQIITELPDSARAGGQALLKNFTAELEARKALQEQQNEFAGASNKRAIEIARVRADAENNALNAAAKLNAELQKFGEGVSADTLKEALALSVGDIEDVLKGTSDLPAAIQELVESAFGDDVTKSQKEFASTVALGQAELAMLERELNAVNMALKEVGDNSDKTADLLEKRGQLETDITKATQEAAIDSFDARVKVLEAEQEAIKKAAEEAKKRIELEEKAADAARKFNDTLRDTAREFEEFRKQKFAELLETEADAQQELKEAQQETLAATLNLADAYKNLQAAQIEFNGVLAQAQLEINLIQRDIGELTGEITNFDGQLSSLQSAFADVLNDANISIEKRIQLERQLAEETLSFLQNARDEIVNAGLAIFGQSGAENAALQQGIQGLQFVADKLGGTFENFLNLSSGDLESLSQELLNLPVDFRKQLLDALNFLPSTTNVGGFSVEQLKQAIGQIGAGVAPEEGLPSIEELNGQQVEQLKIIQQLTQREAALQFSAVAAAQRQVELAEEQLDIAEIQEERARENLIAVRDAVLEETAVLEAANAERQELTAQVIAADDKNTLLGIEKQAQLFQEQNEKFSSIGDKIVSGISSAIQSKLGSLSASAAVNGAAGLIPNFSTGNLTPSEAAGVLRAAHREKGAMPAGAGLAVANTSEAIIPMRARGFVPHFQGGNEQGSVIAGTLDAVRAINQTAVAAIAQSISQAFLDIQGQDNTVILNEISNQLGDLLSVSRDGDEKLASISSNTEDAATGGAAGGTAQTGATQDVNITVQTNQQSTVTVTGLESIRDEIEESVRTAADEQVQATLQPILDQIEAVIEVLQNRGLLSSIGQAG